MLGRIAYGDVNQFLSVCDWVSVMAYCNSSEKILEVCQPIFKACGKAASVSVCVKTATNDEISTSASAKWLGITSANDDHTEREWRRLPQGT